MTTQTTRIFVDLSLDWRVFGFTTALAALTCLLFGLLPAIRATAQTPGAAMKAGSRGTTDSRERFGIRRVLVVAQVALSLVLVVGALLFVRSLRNLTDARRRVPSGRHSRDESRFAPRRHSRGAANGALRGHHGAHSAPARCDRRGAGVHRADQRFWLEQQHRHRRKEVEGERQFQPRERPIISGRWARRCSPAATSTHATPSAEPTSRSSPNRSRASFFGGRNPVGQTFQIDEAAGQAPAGLSNCRIREGLRSTAICATSSSRSHFSPRRRISIPTRGSR